MSAFEWPHGARCAVSLTYDDGLAVHADETAPSLIERGLRGTFYVPARSDIMQRPDAWRAVAAAGHELGNHSCFHPCRRDKPNMDWLHEAYDLCAYTPKRWTDEMRVANLVLSLVDGKPATQRSFGNTCCNLTLGAGEQEVSLGEFLPELVVAARGGYRRQVVDPAQANLFDLGHFGADGRTLDDLRPELEAARETGGWIVYMIHGIGEATHNLHMNPEAHTALIDYLSENRNDYWTAPLVDVARYVKDKN